MLISFGLALEWIPVAAIKAARPGDPCVFVGHCTYTPMLALAAYLALALAFHHPNMSRKWRGLLVLFVAFVVLDLFLTKGVTGYASFFALMALFVLLTLKSFWKSVLLGTLALSVALALAWSFSPFFKDRVVQNMTEARLFFDEPLGDGTSIGPRLLLWKNTGEIIKENSVLGVGAGGLSDELAQRMTVYEKRIRRLRTPHSGYLSAWAEGGIPGLVLIVLIFASQLWFGLRSKEWCRPLQIGLPFFMLLIMLVDGHPYVSRIAIIYLLMCSVLNSKRTD